MSAVLLGRDIGGLGVSADRGTVGLSVGLLKLFGGVKGTYFDGVFGEVFDRLVKCKNRSGEFDVACFGLARYKNTLFLDATHPQHIKVLLSILYTRHVILYR